MKLQTLYTSFKKEIKVYKLVLQDKRTPKMGKFFLGLAIAYMFMPFDLIPDFIPVLGHVDDVIIIPLFIYIAIKCIPDTVINDNRKNVKE